VIVGAGATGLELAGALAEIAYETLNMISPYHPTEAQIVLMELGRACSQHSPKTSRKGPNNCFDPGVKSTQRRESYECGRRWCDIRARLGN